MQEIQKIIQKGVFIRSIRTLLEGYDIARPGHYYVVEKRSKDKSDSARKAFAFKMFLHPHWHWCAAGVVCIGKKTYYIKSKPTAPYFVDFNTLVVTKDIETKEAVNRKLIEVMAEQGIKTELRFESGLIIVTKDKRGRYDILDIGNLHTNTIDETDKVVERTVGYVDGDNLQEDLTSTAEMVKGLLPEGGKLFLEIHLHLDDENLQIFGTEVAATTIDGRLTSHMVMNEKAKARIFIPRQAYVDFPKTTIPFVLDIVGNNYEGHEKILKKYYLIREVDLSSLLEKRLWKKLVWQKISWLFSKPRPTANISIINRVKAINLLDAAA